MSDQSTEKQKGKTAMPADKKKAAIIVAIAVILVLNILWTVLQNKFTPKVDEVRADLAKIEARLAKLEAGGLPDVEKLRSEFGALKTISDKYEGRIAQMVKVEEEQLAALESQIAAQRARVESLKKLDTAANAVEEKK